VSGSSAGFGGSYGADEKSASTRVYRYTLSAPCAKQYARRWNCRALSVGLCVQDRSGADFVSAESLGRCTTVDRDLAGVEQERIRDVVLAHVQ
jgi:hypothetical protein